MIIVLPFVFNALVSGAGALLLFLLLSLIFVAVFGSVVMDALKELVILSATSGITGTTGEPASETIGSLLALLSEPSVVFFLAVSIVMAALVLGIIRAFFYSGAVAMSSEIYGEKKTNLRTMLNGGKRFLWRYWDVEIVLALLVIIWLFVFSVPWVLSGNITLVVIPVLSIVPLIFVYVLFALSCYYVVIEDLGVWKALGRSLEVVKKNYWPMVGLGLLFILMSSVVGMIPWIGGLLNLLVVLPCQTIAFAIFAIEHSEH